MSSTKYMSIMNLDLIKDTKYFSRNYELPIVEATHSVPNELVPIDKAKSQKNKDCWIHGFVNDEKFMQYWASPEKCLKLAKEYSGMISLDFSFPLYAPRYLALQSIIWNRVTASYLQNSGIDIIPSVRWGLRSSYDFAFEGIRPGGTIAIGTLGCTKDPELYTVLNMEIETMLETLQPETIVVYGPHLDDPFNLIDKRGVKIIQFESETTKVHRLKEEQTED